ncbi:MAG: hypothetical protein ACXVIJ_00265 [Thermoanaerobaculia bacterium]
MTHRAYGYARLSAQRSGLLANDDVVAMRFTSDAASADRAARARGIESESKRFERLLARHRVILHCYRDARPLVRALLGLHEVENVKLGWRAIVRKIEPDRWTPLWRDFHDLETVSIDCFRQSHTLHDAIERLSSTPYAAIARNVASAHPADLGSAELALDRWASMQVVAEANALPKSESLARLIAEGIIHLRDDEIERRGMTAYGLSPGAIDAACVFPRRKKWPELAALCRRAFRGRATLLAPAIAYAALADRDYRTGRALTERSGDSDLDSAVDRAIGWSGGVR